MAALGRYLYNIILGPKAAAMNETSEKTWTPCVLYDAERYQPSINEVLKVKDVLLKKTGLPLELVDSIVDFAEYWPHTTTTRAGTKFTVKSGGPHENKFMTRSFPLGFISDPEDNSGYQIWSQYLDKFHTHEPKPWDSSRNVPQSATEEVLGAWGGKSMPRGEFPCRKIVFTISSHDQGWGGTAATKNTYENSYTWFDVGKETLSAFREELPLESWQIAPWSQFRLYLDGQGSNEEEVQQIPTTSNPAPLVCSLRTLSPASIPDLSNSADPDTPFIFKHELNPSANVLQKNITANKFTRQHKIAWKYTDDIDPQSLEADNLEKSGRGKETGTGEYVRNMKVGDTVTVWAKARFPGWVNVVEGIQIDVYWAV